MLKQWTDAHLETSWAPVDELDGPLGLDGGDSRVDVLGHHITTVQQAASHVLAVTGIALHHLVGGLEARVGDLSHRQLLVVGLLGGDDRGVGGQREVDTRVGHQVGLELSQIDVEGTIEAQGGGDGGHDLRNQPVQVGVGRALDVQITPVNDKKSSNLTFFSYIWELFSYSVIVKRIILLKIFNTFLFIKRNVRVFISILYHYWHWTSA